MPSAPQICTARSTTRLTASATKVLAIDDSFPPLAPLSSTAARVPDEGPAGRDVDLRIGHHLLDHAEVTEQTAEGLAGRRPVDGDVLGAPGQPEPPHAVRQPGRGQPYLGVFEATVDLAEDCLWAHSTAVEHDLAMPAEQALVERPDVALDPHTWVVGVDEKHRRAAPVAS